MSNEAQVISILTVTVKDADGNTLLRYQSSPNNFFADVPEEDFPVPGTVTVPVEGINIDLSSLTTPGLAFFTNLDEDNFVTWGRYDEDNDIFYPCGELLPGEAYVQRLSRNVETEFSGTGTVEGGNTTHLRFKADTASCQVKVHVFEK